MPAGSSVAALAPAPLYVPAGSTSSAAEEVAPVTGIYVPDPRAWARWRPRRCTCRPDRPSPLPRRSRRAGNKRAGIRQHRRARARRTVRPGRVLGRGAGARGAISSRRIGRRRARARAAVSAGRVDDLSRRGGRPGEWNISAGIRQRGRAGAAPLYVPAGSIVGVLDPAGGVEAVDSRRYKDRQSTEPKPPDRLRIQGPPAPSVQW